MHENKEMKLLTSLLKKEFLEYSRNKMNGILFIFTLLFALFVPAPVEVKQMKMTVDGAHLFVLLLVIAVMLIHQYMYDSCQNDFTSGGTIFMSSVFESSLSEAPAFFLSWSFTTSTSTLLPLAERWSTMVKNS